MFPGTAEILPSLAFCGWWWGGLQSLFQVKPNVSVEVALGGSMVSAETVRGEDVVNILPKNGRI